LNKRGLLNRIFGGRLRRLMNHSWQMYRWGFCSAWVRHGIGGRPARHDRRRDRGQPARSGGTVPSHFVRRGHDRNGHHDGVLMCKAYDWAFLNPLRKIFYNLTTTGCRLPSPF